MSKSSCKDRVSLKKMLTRSLPALLFCLLRFYYACLIAQGGPDSSWCETEEGIQFTVSNELLEEFGSEIEMLDEESQKSLLTNLYILPCKKYIGEYKSLTALGAVLAVLNAFGIVVIILGYSFIGLTFRESLCFSTKNYKLTCMKLYFILACGLQSLLWVVGFATSFREMDASKTLQSPFTLMTILVWAAVFEFEFIIKGKYVKKCCICSESAHLAKKAKKEEKKRLKAERERAEERAKLEQ